MRMQSGQVMLMMCLLCIGLSACVSKKAHLAREADLTEQLNNETKVLIATRAALEKTQNRHDRVAAELKSLQADHDDLQQQHDALTDKLSRISETTETLKTDLVARESMLNLQRQIEQDLKQQIANQEVKIEDIEGRLKVTFVDKILFSTGRSTINAKGQESLLKISESLRGQSNQAILVEGHTDDVPIGPVLQKQLASNWELSTARATSVVRFLQESGEIDPTRLSACGYSQYRPLAPNETEAERSQNRRIEIILIPPK